MPRILLTLALLWSQALALVGPGFVLCQPRHGGVRVEWAGAACTSCDDHAHDDEADALPACDASADRPGGCRHTPLADTVDQPCVVSDRMAADPVSVAGFDWCAAEFDLLTNADDPRQNHDPPPPSACRSSHLPLLAGVVLRC